MPSMACTPPYVPPVRVDGLAVKQPPAVWKEPSAGWHFSVHCVWCGRAWRRRFRTYRSGLRFVRGHVPRCFRRAHRCVIQAAVAHVRAAGGG